MLRGISAKQLQEWEVFSDLEVLPMERLTWLVASVVQIVANANRGKGRSAHKLRDCKLDFGDALAPVPVEPDWRKMRDFAKAMTEASQRPKGRRRNVR